VKRREFITLCGGAAAAWPMMARAQQADKAVRVGFFGNSLTSPPSIAYYQAFLARLRELGFT
jgi:putative ABC transport system substrate-binding protein